MTRLFVANKPGSALFLRKACGGICKMRQSVAVLPLDIDNLQA
jgi:hypothetical protein